MSTRRRPKIRFIKLKITGINDKTWEAQADYTLKLSDIARIEAGYKGTFQRNESPVDTYTGTNESDIQQDKTLYNRFLYNQDVHALLSDVWRQVG